MFELFEECEFECEQLSDSRKNKIRASVLSRIKEDKPMKKHIKIKPLVIAAAIAIFSGVSILSVSAAIQANTVNFLMNGKELGGEYYDYVDSEGYRHISFGAALPVYEEDFAIIYDVDAPQGENVRVITKDSDRDFIEQLYIKNRRNGTDGIDSEPIFKDSELCIFTWSNGSSGGTSTFGGKFMNTGAAAGQSSGFEEKISGYDYETGARTYKASLYYYVGKEQTE